ncbi:MAG: peptidylprolyl isomerase [Planctomycetes bacterium]|nr:peptidylprolyl isomerase [Planctomycetota bacterium]
MVAYAKHPSANGDLIGFLGAVAALEARREEYEVATRIFQQLVDNGVESQALYELAIPSAFNANDFDVTEKYLALEKEKKLHFGAVVSPEYREKLGYYKKAWEREQQLRAAELEANDLPRVKLRTNKGEIELELFENEAPNTVANFIALVESGFYSDLTFFRVVARELAEAGCPVGDGTGGPNHQIISECRVPNRRTHFRGSVTMMTSDSFTNGSVFGICLIPAGEIDGRHTVFGRVIRGMDVLSKLQRRAPRDEMSQAINPNANVVIPPADRIIAATVVRKRTHPYQPKVIIGTPPTTKATEPALE